MKKSIQIFMVIVLAGCLAVIAGCEGTGGDASDVSNGRDSASLSFFVEWVDETEPLTLAAAVKLSDDCSSRGVSNVRVSVRDSLGASLKSATFACRARQGTLTGVTPGSNRTIRVSGLTSSGTETWRGEKTGVNLAAGDNNIGTIQVERVNNQAPTAAITSPADNSSYTYGDIVSFVGTGTDPEDGDVLGSRFDWTSSRDGEIQSGRKSFSISSLSVGTHTITLTVTDSDGDTGMASISIIISTATSGDTFTNTLGMTFVKINAGTFWMGSPSDEADLDSDETRHQVTLTKGYYLQTTEVTQGQWKAVMGDNPSYFSSCGDDCPVERVSWNDVQDFISALNTMEGTTKYRLPTEAEWEYACRAGTTTPFSFGNCLSTSQANYDGNYPYTGCSSGTYRETPIAVGILGTNAWGLYDMHGNVWEWCSDWYGSYSSSAVTDPTGPSSGANRVLRGGSWSYGAMGCRSAIRRDYDPDYRDWQFGFRLAAVLPGH